VLFAALLFVHLGCFAAYVGAAFAQLQFMKRSRKAGLPVETRNHLEELAATVITKIEVPVIFGSLLSGVGFIAMNPLLMKQGWLHAKLTCVLILLVLSHLEMFNARKLVRARAANAPEPEIEARKKRHDMYGRVGAVVVVAILVLVTFVRLG
jgi:uncharacterized membrane protein